VRAVLWALLLIIAVMPTFRFTWLARAEDLDTDWRVPALWWYAGLACLGALQAQQGTLVWFALLLPVLLAPALVRPKQSDTSMVFYGGGCAICHSSVRFLISEDRSGTAFRFAPLGGARFRKLVPENARAGLPDSMVLRTPDGRLLTKSEAAIEAGRRLGGYWRVLAVLAAMIPRAWRDAAYDAVASRRKRWFSPPPEVCPVMSEELRRRVDD
jgi:predicted DCC family thiol-disulfide oxidoreductase YuxK